MVSEMTRLEMEVEKIRPELPEHIRIYEMDGRHVFQIKDAADVPQGFGIYFWTEVNKRPYKYGVEISGGENIADALRSGVKEFQKHLDGLQG